MIYCTSHFLQILNISAGLAANLKVMGTVTGAHPP